MSEHTLDRVEFANGVVWNQAMIQTMPAELDAGNWIFTTAGNKADAVHAQPWKWKNIACY